MDGADPESGTNPTTAAVPAAPRDRAMSTTAANRKIVRRIYAASDRRSARLGIVGSEKRPDDSATRNAPDASMMPNNITTLATIFWSPIHQLYSLDFHQKFHWLMA